MFKTIRTRRGLVGTAAALGVLAAGVVGGVAIADDSTVKAKAPHAQASALVNTDGSRLYSKGIKSLTKPKTGEYCVTFDDATGIKVDRSTPVATLYAIEGTAPWGGPCLSPPTRPRRAATRRTR
ncbi:hypothetical protein [Streptomyces sp. NPDC058304]|uniref:hypothetical protein n=1 Tax=Streptomyces sp. NPDC058304 TaxID=3346437 RepID=UPI0036E419F9